MFLYATLCTGEVSAELSGANRVLRKAPKQSVSFALGRMTTDSPSSQGMHVTISD